MVQLWPIRLVSAEFGVWVTKQAEGRGGIVEMEMTIVISRDDDAQHGGNGFGAS